MKNLLLALLASTTQAGAPVQKHLPGWQLGTPGAKVDIRVFYDLLCPDSKAAHYVWKDLFKEESPVKGVTYNELVDMKVTAFVLPYHAHSFEITRGVPYLEDLGTNRFEEYGELSWANWESILAAKDVSIDDFWKDTWTPMVVKNMGLNE